MSKHHPTEPYPPHRILREIYRHYLEFRDFITSPTKDSSEEGLHNGVIEHGYWVYTKDDKKDYKVHITISFWDLHGALHNLSKRKREAVFYNVILDWKQKDVAKTMGITTVSVGQYVEQAMLQLSDRYFAEELKSSEVTNGKASKR